MLVPRTCSPVEDIICRMAALIAVPGSTHRVCEPVVKVLQGRSGNFVGVSVSLDVMISISGAKGRQARLKPPSAI